MNLCIITPITTKNFRDTAALSELVPGGISVKHTTLEHGPASVESAIDEVLAGPGIIDAACRAEIEGFDAIVIDCMLDPALEATREAVNIPVIGCGEAGLYAAAEFGRFSVVTVLQRQDHSFRRIAESCDLSDRLASVYGIGVNVLELDSARNHALEATIEACEIARLRDKAESIVFGCTGMLGYGRKTASALGWPSERVIDPLPNALKAAIGLVKKGHKPDKERYPFPERKPILGFDSWPILRQRLHLD